MLRVVWNIIKTLFSFVFRIVSPFRRLVCRKRKSSVSDNSVPVGSGLSYDSTTIDMTQSVPVNSEMEMQAWDSWDNEDQNMSSNAQRYNHASSSQHYINSYRNKKMQEPESEPEIDFFQDLAPEVKKAPKIFLKKREEGNINQSAISNRLAMTSEVPIATSELESWDDSNSAWADESQEDLSWQADAAIREKKRLERQERSLEHQRKKMERDMKHVMKRDGHLNAVKLS